MNIEWITFTDRIEKLEYSTRTLHFQLISFVRNCCRWRSDRCFASLERIDKNVPLFFDSQSGHHAINVIQRSKRIPNTCIHYIRSNEWVCNWYLDNSELNRKNLSIHSLLEHNARQCCIHFVVLSFAFEHIIQLEMSFRWLSHSRDILHSIRCWLRTGRQTSCSEMI